MTFSRSSVIMLKATAWRFCWVPVTPGWCPSSQPRMGLTMRWTLVTTSPSSLQFSPSAMADEDEPDEALPA